jgi:hypothetical protein
MDLPPAPPVILVQMSKPAFTEADLAARAQADGWTASQAEWIGKLGMAAAGASQSGAPSDAFEETYKLGRKALTVAYFDNALKEGKTRLVAFLTVIDLEKQLAERRGGPAPAYQDDWLKAAYVELARAAERNASSSEQLDIAFEMLRTLAAAAK